MDLHEFMSSYKYKAKKMWSLVYTVLHQVRLIYDPTKETMVHVKWCCSCSVLDCKGPQLSGQVWNAEMEAEAKGESRTSFIVEENVIPTSKKSNCAIVGEPASFFFFFFAMFLSYTILSSLRVRGKVKAGTSQCWVLKWMWMNWILNKAPKMTPKMANGANSKNK